jgi:FkbM family methyltransferase
MSISSKFYQTVFNFRQLPVGVGVAKLWHRFAPPIHVWRKVYGLYVCMDLRDSLYWWATDVKRIETSEPLEKMLAGIKGNIWDIGCNVGIFSLYAASQGNQVTAFDLSPKAVRLLEKGARRNKFNIQTVSRAFSTTSFTYSPPADADTRNQVAEASHGSHQSITFLEAEKQYGTPVYIKLDVEHHETVFFKSVEFHDWIKNKRITLMVELHETHYWDLVWQDVPHVRFDDFHVLFNPID